MARVRLHTGNPVRDSSPPWGARDIAGSNPEFARRRPPRPPKCGWCGSTTRVDASTPRRCARCRKLEVVIAAANTYVASHGLRPIGGSEDSESDAELSHRRSALAARKKLNSVKLAPRKPAAKKPAATASKKKAKAPSKATKKPVESTEATIARMTSEVNRVTELLDTERSSDHAITPERELRFGRLEEYRAGLMRGIQRRTDQS